MSRFPQNVRPVQLDYATDDRAVFNFFNAVYAWMCAGLGVTAVTAWFVSQSPALLRSIYTQNRGVAVAIMLGSVLMVWGIQAAARKISAGVAVVLFLIYSALIGSILSGIFIVYKLPTIGGAFVITAGMFGGMSIYGFVTKRDLTRMGAVLFMAVWGLLIASLVNIFTASDGLSWIITYAVVVVFTLLTAYHTQKLKQIAAECGGDANLAGRYAIIGALLLYLDFINIFLSILRILGSRK